jgi:acetolactate synthase-1/2/3 large subunit
LGNGLANLHNARRARSGVVNIVGEHASDHVGLDSPLTSDLEGIARPVSHWVRTTRSARAIGVDARAAIEAACTPPGGVATLALPADAAWTELAPDTPVPAPGSQRPPLLYRPLSPEAVGAAARELCGPGPTLMLLGGQALRAPALEIAGRIAARTGCALMSEFYTACLARGAGRVIAPRLPYAVEPAQAALARFRRIILVGARPPVAFFAYPDKASDLVPEGCTVHVLAAPDEDAPAALAALAAALDAPAEAPLAPEIKSTDMPA